MTYEILYTSAPQGLKPGSFGFCTVAASEGIPPPLLQRLESLSGYRHLYPPGHPRAALNPVNYAHLLVQVGGRRLHVLSRIADAGWDYSQRTNKLAHHVVLEESECIPPGPAWLLAQPGFCLTQFSGSPRVLPPNRPLPPGELLPARCVMWEQVTGDAGWAGVLVRQALEKKQSAYLIFREGMELLPLLLEAQALLPPKERWEVTFSTYYTRLPPGVDCLWRCVLTGSAEAQEAQTARSALVLDLTRPLGPAPDDPWTQAARDGLPAPRELLPASPSVGSSSLSSTAAAGTIPPAPWDSSSPPLDLPGWSGIDSVSAANRNGLMAPPAPPPLTATRGWSWAAMAAGLLLGLFLGAAGAVIALRPPPPLPAVDQKVPDSQPLSQDTTPPPNVAEHATDATPDISNTSASPETGSPSADTSPSSSPAVTVRTPDAHTRSGTRLAEQHHEPAPKLPSEDPQNTPQQTANPLSKQLGWSLDKLPKPGESCDLADDLPGNPTTQHLSLLPSDLFTIEKKDSHTVDIVLTNNPLLPSNARNVAATLTLSQNTIKLTWGPRITTDRELQKLISHVVVYHDTSSSPNTTPRYISIWRPYTINHTLRLRHCFPSERLYSWNDSTAGPRIPCFTPDIFPEEDLYFRTTEAPNLFGILDTGTPASGSLEQPSAYYKATHGVTWNHNILGSSCAYRYTIKLLRQAASSQPETAANAYTLWGAYMLDQERSNDDKESNSNLVRAWLGKILNSRGDLTKLIRHKKAIELAVIGDQILTDLKAASEQSKNHAHERIDSRLLQRVQKWLGDVQTSGVLPNARFLNERQNTLTELQKAKQESSQIYMKLIHIVKEVSDLIENQLVNQPITRSMLDELKMFRDIILSREEMFARDGTGGPEVSVELYRRVEVDETEPPRYLPVIRFGATENHEGGWGR